MSMTEVPFQPKSIHGRARLLDKSTRDPADTDSPASVFNSAPSAKASRKMCPSDTWILQLGAFVVLALLLGGHSGLGAGPSDDWPPAHTNHSFPDAYSSVEGLSLRVVAVGDVLGRREVIVWMSVQNDRDSNWVLALMGASLLLMTGLILFKLGRMGSSLSSGASGLNPSSRRVTRGMRLDGEYPPAMQAQ